MKLRSQDRRVFDGNQTDIDFLGMFFVTIRQAGAALSTKPTPDAGRGDDCLQFAVSDRE